jgi:virulence-associated protein VapD
MTKLKLDQLRNRMDQCVTETNKQNQEKISLANNIRNITNSYDTLTLKITKAKNDTLLKEVQLKTEQKNIYDIKQKIINEKSLVSMLNQYIAEYNESQQVIPDISLLGIEDSNILNEIIDNVNQEL